MSGGSMLSYDDWRTRMHYRNIRVLRPRRVDRLTTLPDDLLSRILSSLPTKDAASTRVLSKRMARPFSQMTSLDFDDFPISHCARNTHLITRYPLFLSFIDNVLHKLIQPAGATQQPLTRFRLRLGKKHKRIPHNCYPACFPYLDPARLKMWISYPITYRSVKELDLSFYVRNSSECKLPHILFFNSSLQVLRLNSNLELDEGAEIPVIYLPNLKLLHLCDFTFEEDEFITSLVSGCPALEDLSITRCIWKMSENLVIHSPSLLRLRLYISKHYDFQFSEVVNIETPNLQYFDYFDNLAHCYAIEKMNALVEARIDINGLLQEDSHELLFESLSNLLGPMTYNIQHLSLIGFAAENMSFADDLMDKMPMFRNLRTLEMDGFLFCESRWDIALLTILKVSPVLETLVFSEGLFHCAPNAYGVWVCEESDVPTFEAEGWGRAQCAMTHLKRIEFKKCFGYDRELNMIKFLLSKASVLEELVLQVYYSEVTFQPDLADFVNAIKKQEKASNSCSIILNG